MNPATHQRICAEIQERHQREITELKRQKDALMEELENIATAEWREFDPDTRRCAYEFVLWAQSRARHTLNRVLSGDVTKPLPEDVKLVQVGPCSCSDHECGQCMQPAPKVGAGGTARPPTPTGWSDTDWLKHLQEQQHPLAGLHINQGSMDAASDAYEAEYNAAKSAKCDCLSFWESHHQECPTMRHNTLCTSFQCPLREGCGRAWDGFDLQTPFKQSWAAFEWRQTDSGK